MLFLIFKFFKVPKFVKILVAIEWAVFIAVVSFYIIYPYLDEKLALFNPELG